MPWNLVYDERPAKHKAAFQTGAGRRAVAAVLVDPLQPDQRAAGRAVARLPVWNNPRVIVVIDPTVYEEMHDEQKQRSTSSWPRRSLTTVGSMDELEPALEEGYPQLLYWLGHATPDYLTLGDERITPSDLRNLLRSFDDRERPEGMLAFLNACQTAEAGAGGSFLEVLHSFGFTGAIATEQQTIDNFANEFGLAFLQGFLQEGKPLGELLHALRLNRRRWACSTAPIARPRSASVGDGATGRGTVDDPGDRPGRGRRPGEVTVRLERDARRIDANGPSPAGRRCPLPRSRTAR